MGVLQERITSTRGHSITSMQAIYVPADDYTDPAPATTFAHLDATTELSREIASLGIYPGRGPADVHQPYPRPPYITEEHYTTAVRVRQILQRNKELQDIIAILGIDELSEEDKILVRRPAAQRFLSQNTYVAKQFTGIEGSTSRSRTPSRPSRRSATVTTTTSASRRSSCVVASTTSSASGPRSRRTSDGSHGRARRRGPQGLGGRGEPGQRPLHRRRPRHPAGSTPILCVLGEGEVRVNTDGAWRTAVVDGGFLSVDHDRVTIVAESVDASGMGS